MTPQKRPRNAAGEGTLMTPAHIASLMTTYRDGLLKDVVPFWINHAIDREYGGYTHCLGRDGTVIDTDKSIWVHGRFAWLLATLYSEVEPRPEWLALSKHGLDFLRKYGFDKDGRMYFLVTRDGRPLRKRRYIFSESFAIIALAAYAKAAGDAAALKEATDLFKLTAHYLTTPGLLPPKWNTEVRPMRGLAVPMIMMSTAQVLRGAGGDPELCNSWIDRCIDEIERYHMHPELEAILETVAPNGDVIDHFDGRTLNPGHAMEAAWFILREARQRNNDARLLKMGTTILDWSWRWGWDEEYGGIIYYRDLKHLPVAEYWHDMKDWWPQNETIIATLMAYQMTGDEKYAQWHKLTHDWAYSHFPDREFGEWFGYLHRDGRISVTLKGNWWKGPFHLPRMQLICWKLLEEMQHSR